MNIYKTITMVLMMSVVVACGDKPAPATDAPKNDTESVPMSAEPAEPTGVMNTEPVEPVEVVESEPATGEEVAATPQEAQTPAPAQVAN